MLKKIKNTLAMTLSIAMVTIMLQIPAVASASTDKQLSGADSEIVRLGGKAIQPTAYFGTLIYTVVPGDTLYRIAHNYNSTIENILKFNKIPNPTLIHPGQKIIVPLSPPEAIIYTVKSGDNLYRISIKYGTTVNNLVKYNYLSSPDFIYPKQHLVITASLK